tara:strand:- start:49 stop:720 length:672 start_codon:yes stop_codon:yes gene_type:complete
MKKLFLIVILFTSGCSTDEEIICTDSELGVNCQGADYIQNSDSPYVLPWEIGKTFVMGQLNCTDGSHSRERVYAQFAYDIPMPIGTNLVAVQSGKVVGLAENFEDVKDGVFDESLIDKANYINIEHLDGTRASYVHLTTNGALKSIGDNVIQGEVIALSGNSGWSSRPHLHFQLNKCIDTDDRPNYTWIVCNSVPITFKNTSEHCFGLLGPDFKPNGYTAEPY